MSLNDQCASREYESPVTETLIQIHTPLNENKCKWLNETKISTLTLKVRCRSSLRFYLCVYSIIFFLFNFFPLWSLDFDRFRAQRAHKKKNIVKRRNKLIEWSKKSWIFSYCTFSIFLSVIVKRELSRKEGMTKRFLIGIFYFNFFLFFFFFKDVFYSEYEYTYTDARSTNTTGVLIICCVFLYMLHKAINASIWISWTNCNYYKYIYIIYTYVCVYRDRFMSISIYTI